MPKTATETNADFIFLIGFGRVSHPRNWPEDLVLVGGAPLNEEFAKAIGADAYCRDAAIAVETAKALMTRRHNQLAANA